MTNTNYADQLAASQQDWRDRTASLMRTWRYVVSNHTFEWPPVGHPTVPLPREPQEATGNNMLTFRSRGDKPTNIA